jgi:hypothetical protein
MVQASRSGDIFAFVAGTGLVRQTDGAEDWTVLSNGFEGRYVLHLAGSHEDPNRLYVATYDPATRAQSILTSGDAGATWSELGGEG